MEIQSSSFLSATTFSTSLPTSISTLDMKSTLPSQSLASQITEALSPKPAIEKAVLSEPTRTVEPQPAAPHFQSPTRLSRLRRQACASLMLWFLLLLIFIVLYLVHLEKINPKNRIFATSFSILCMNNAVTSFVRLYFMTHRWPPSFFAYQALISLVLGAGYVIYVAMVVSGMKFYIPVLWVMAGQLLCEFGCLGSVGWSFVRERQRVEREKTIEEGFGDWGFELVDRMGEGFTTGTDTVFVIASAEEEEIEEREGAIRKEIITVPAQAFIVYDGN
jgi:hypothetical protein